MIWKALGIIVGTISWEVAVVKGMSYVFTHCDTETPSGVWISFASLIVGLLMMFLPFYIAAAVYGRREAKRKAAHSRGGGGFCYGPPYGRK